MSERTRQVLPPVLTGTIDAPTAVISTQGPPASMLGSLAERMGCAPLQRRLLQRRAASGGGASGTSGGGSRSGEPLPLQVQAQMEGSFGVDFSAVRVHQGAEAEAQEALAYTQGTDIHFAPGQYDPHSPGGQELLGHELAHVVQQ